MKTILALLATALAFSNVQAYTPLGDQADGAYSVTFDASGQAVTKRHEDNALSRPLLSAKFRRSEVSSVERRDFPSQQPVCTGRDIPNHYDYSVVQNCLGTWLNKNTDVLEGATSTVYYCRSGDTLLAICNYPYNLYGSSAELEVFNSVMDRTCGAWRSGYVWIPDWNKSVSYHMFFCIVLLLSFGSVY
jgi:hypothetical protein